jgi:CDP-L-myo-inositol myo-inositolphosphotransferase
MGDHIYERGFFFEAINGRGLIIDEVGKYIDKEEATKVYYEDGRVIDIGKNLKEYNAFDTGFFILDGSFLKFAEELEAEKEELKMSEIVKRANLECFPVSGYFWMDVDTKKDLKRAKRFLIKKSVKSAGDGWISRLINRKISTKLTELLVDKLSPNQATLLSFFLGLLSSFTLFFSIPLGALLYQISSIIDGIDGEIARVKMAGTEFGGWLDSVLDRIVDFSFLSVLLLKLKPEGTLLITGLLAIFGTVMVSYVSERFRGAFRVPLHEAIPEIKYIIGKRDERIFLIFILALLGFIKELFIILAIITNLRVLLSSYFVFVKYGTENL